MIKLTLKELNEAYPALNAAAERVTAGKMKYRFARVVKSAKEHIDQFAIHLAELAQKHGAKLVGGNRFDFADTPTDAAIAFNKEAEAWMKSEVVELWGDPEYFGFDELEAATDPKNPISAAIIASLLFLISEPKETEEKPKTAAATA